MACRPASRSVTCDNLQLSEPCSCWPVAAGVGSGLDLPAGPPQITHCAVTGWTMLWKLTLTYTVLQSCQCVDWSSWSADRQTWMTSTCTGSEPYTVTWSTHALFDVGADGCGGSGSGGSLVLTVSVVRPTSHDYVRPSETITFQLSTTPSDSVVYHVNFDDPR